jgi:hypothetical protein
MGFVLLLLLLLLGRERSQSSRPAQHAIINPARRDVANRSDTHPLPPSQLL